jgi:uncharacterized protein (TIGR03437 family)
MPGLRKSGWRTLHALAWLVAVATTNPTASAQFVQEAGKLVRTGTIGNSAQGGAVALSADGNTAIAGGPSDNSAADGEAIGAAWVYIRSGDSWTQQAKLVGTDAVGFAYQGASVGLSADGNTAIVGGTGDNGGIGAAWVFVRAGTAWSQQGSKLVGSGALFKSVQGSSVALSADGTTAIVGGWYDDGSVGAAWIYTRSGTTWSQQGPKLVGAGIAGMTAQGWSCALSADGNTALVGGVNGGGASWVFTRSGTVWSQQGGPLVGNDAVGLAQQGDSVALSADGNTAIVGGHGDSPNGFTDAGAAWIFARSGGTWTQQGAKLIGTGVVGIGCQGNSVSLSSDGHIALVGGDCDNLGLGTAWVYTRAGTTWTQQGGKLVAAGLTGEVFFGSGVALSGDGSTSMISSAAGVWPFVQATGPRIAFGGVVNGAAYQPEIAPDTWISILGAKLSATTRSWTAADFSGNNLPTQLDGVGVTVNGKPAYVSYISPLQINALAPDDTPQGNPVAVQVTFAGIVSNAVTVTEAPLAPALFTFSQQGGKYLAAIAANGIYVGPPNLIPGLTTGPAAPGDTIVLFGTGFGPSTPANVIGQLPDPAPLAAPVTVNIGGVLANTQFAGIVSPGLYQFNVVVPNVTPGDNPVSIEIGGSFSQGGAFLTVRP